MQGGSTVPLLSPRNAMPGLLPKIPSLSFLQLPALTGWILVACLGERGRHGDALPLSGTATELRPPCAFRCPTVGRAGQGGQGNEHDTRDKVKEMLYSH